MKTREEAAAYGLTFPDSYEDRPFKDQRWQVIRVKPGKKIFLWIYEKDELIHLNVKADPRWRDFWRAAYPAVIPGYHQNKEHWNTIILDGSVPDKDIERMIGESYDLVTDSPTKRIYEAVKRIPKGHVATYRQVAKMAGNEKMSRAVGNALHKNPDPDHIPCFRVVNAKGELAGAFAFGGADVQAISDGLKGELEAIAQAKGIDLSKTEASSGRGSAVPPSARYSTLQDLDAGRHTEIDMFSGALIRMGKELGIPTPYNEYTYHMIKALEEKNDGRFNYTGDEEPTWSK